MPWDTQLISCMILNSPLTKTRRHISLWKAMIVVDLAREVVLADDPDRGLVTGVETGADRSRGAGRAADDPAVEVCEQELDHERAPDRLASNWWSVIIHTNIMQATERNNWSLQLDYERTWKLLVINLSSRVLIIPIPVFFICVMFFKLMFSSAYVISKP